MITIIERAARAIEDELVDHVDPYSDGLSEYGIAQKVVRAVFAAIREPTDAMIDATKHGSSASVRANWEAMIDAALAEEPK